MDLQKLDAVRNSILNSTSKEQLEGIMGMAHLMLLGEYGVFIYNLKNQCCEYYGGHAKQLLGYSEDEINIPMLRNQVHPEDLPRFKQNEKEMKDFFGALDSEQILKFKAGHDFRIRRKDGKYIHIYKQVIPLTCHHALGLEKILILFTNISHIKSNKSAGLIYSGLNGQRMPKTEKRISGNIQQHKSPFSVRELEVLQRIISNKSTTGISAELNISPHTVRIHRKNLLKKSGAKSSLELVLKSKEMGWI